MLKLGLYALFWRAENVWPATWVHITVPTEILLPEDLILLFCAIFLLIARSRRMNSQDCLAVHSFPNKGWDEWLDSAFLYAFSALEAS